MSYKIVVDSCGEQRAIRKMSALRVYRWCWI